MSNARHQNDFVVMEDLPPTSHKVILLGPPGVGKTSVCTRFIEDRMPEPYLRSVGLRVDQKTMWVAGEPLDLTIWDLAGCKDPAELPAYYLTEAAAYLYLIDLSRRETGRWLRWRLRRVRRLLPQSIGLLWANKVDSLGPEERRKVGARLQVAPDAWLSARSGEGVVAASENLAHRLHQIR